MLTPEAVGTTGDILITWDDAVSGGRAWHGFEFHGQETIDQPQLTAILARLVCHRLIDLLPDAALSELCESLGRMYTFYVLGPPTRPKIRYQPPRVQGRLHEAYERPPFEIAEE